MSAVTVRRLVAATVDQTWARVTDLVAHGRHVPLTSVRVDGPESLGRTVLARTAIGPLGFDDPMTVTTWQPPPAPQPRMRLVKRGRVLDGWAEIVVRPVTGGAEVVWTEEILPAHPLRALARPADRLARRATAAMIDRLLDGLLADLPPAGSDR